MARNKMGLWVVLLTNTSWYYYQNVLIGLPSINLAFKGRYGPLFSSEEESWADMCPLQKTWGN